MFDDGDNDATPRSVRKRRRISLDNLSPAERKAKLKVPHRRPEPKPEGQGVDLKLRYLLFVVVLMTAYCYYQMGPKEFHGALVKIGDYLPTSMNQWFQSFHEPKKAAKTNTVKKNGKNVQTEKQKKHDWMSGPSNDPALKVFSIEDITYTEGGPMYLVLMGHVFDVTGAEYYKPGSGYHAFIGQDASRSFVTGEFSKEALTDDLEGMQAGDYTGLANWLKFYLEHETYKFVGYLSGKYFDENGKETEAMARVKSLMKWAELESEKEGDLLKLFPSCNVDWKADVGSTLWCSTKSGGVDRDWVGYPRKFFEKPDKSPRCACVHPNYLADPRVKLYDNCKSDSDTCKLPETAK